MFISDVGWSFTKQIYAKALTNAVGNCKEIH